MMVFKILSIDGGGIKGLYSSTILETLEEKFACKCSDYFDLICGTSTGGLIALALSLKIPASSISQVYLTRGAEIFPKRNRFVGLLKQAALGGKHSDKGLKKVVYDIFRERKLKESNNLLCIPSYSYTDGRPCVFKFGLPDLTRDDETRYMDVALATSAAPTFLPIAEIDNYQSRQFIDGGVWANNPALVGLIEALRHFVGGDRKYKSIKLLSISSLNQVPGKSPGLRRKRSFRHWRHDLFETGMIGQSHHTHHFLEQLNSFGGLPVQYHRIFSENISAEQTKLVQLDSTTVKALNLIRSKGSDQGLLASKDLKVKDFFQSPKTYEVQNGK